MRQWKVTFSIVDGDAYDLVNAASTVETHSLKDALQAWDARTTQCDGGDVEANEYPIRSPHWFYKTFREYDGSVFVTSLHIPDSVTPSSRRRLARVLGVAA